MYLPLKYNNRNTKNNLLNVIDFRKSSIGSNSSARSDDSASRTSTYIYTFLPSLTSSSAPPQRKPSPTKHTASEISHKSPAPSNSTSQHQQQQLQDEDEDDDDDEDVFENLSPKELKVCSSTFFHYYSYCNLTAT